MDEVGTKSVAWRMTLGALVVVAGLATALIALKYCLDHYAVDTGSKAAVGTATSAANDHSSAVVSVMTPLVAAIVGLVGLYFGVSSTGSARGQEAQARQQEAHAKVTDAKTGLLAEAKGSGASPETINKIIA